MVRESHESGVVMATTSANKQQVRNFHIWIFPFANHFWCLLELSGHKVDMKN